MPAPQSLIGESGCEALCDLAQGCPPGCFVEFGVYKGGSAWHLARVAEQQGREIYLYDTFTGIPFKSPIDVHHVGDFSDTSAAAVIAAIPYAKVVIGIFPDSIVPMPPIAFVHVDADQYDSLTSALNVFGPMMVPGGIMVFDDPGCLDGATKAIIDSGRAYEFTRNGKYMMRF